MIYTLLHTFAYNFVKNLDSIAVASAICEQLGRIMEFDRFYDKQLLMLRISEQLALYRQKQLIAINPVREMLFAARADEPVNPVVDPLAVVGQMLPVYRRFIDVQGAVTLVSIIELLSALEDQTKNVDSHCKDAYKNIKILVQQLSLARQYSNKLLHTCNMSILELLSELY